MNSHRHSTREWGNAREQVGALCLAFELRSKSVKIMITITVET